MADTVTMRGATMDDVDAITVMLGAELSHHTVLMPDRFRIPEPLLPDGWLEEQLSRENMRMFLAEKDDVIAGLVLIRVEESHGDLSVPRKFVYVNEVSVLPEYRGQGIGSVMMAYVEEWAVEQGITELELNVWESNTGAVRLYERLGYGTLNRRMIKKL